MQIHYALRRFLKHEGLFNKGGAVLRGKGSGVYYEPAVIARIVYRALRRYVYAAWEQDKMPLHVAIHITRSYNTEHIQEVIWVCEHMLRKKHMCQKIQRQWRMSIANPAYALCRNVLLREFHGLLEDE